MLELSVIQEVKGLTEILYAYICTSSDENLFTCKISGPKLLRILSYASS